jgi:hypothetical protein
MVSDFGDALRGNRDPIHLLRAPFRCGDSSRGRFWGPSGHSLRLYVSVRPVLPGLRCVVRRPNPAPTAGF